MIEKVTRSFQRILPTKIKRFLLKVYFRIKYRQVNVKHKKALERVRKKDILTVAFFVIDDAVWKYDGVYNLMKEDSRFDPIVVIIPIVIFGQDIMLERMNRGYNTFSNKGYNVIKTLNVETGNWLDVNKVIEPDIVFFTNPHKLTKEEYFITTFSNYLTCYVPYFYHVTKHLKENYGSLTNNLVWKVFYESNIHLEYAKKYSYNNASNTLVTGYPGLDSFLFKNMGMYDPWKIKNRNYKRIIWAPHHTISGQDVGLGLSNFTQYADYFVSLLSKYHDKIQIAFKPHPLLKVKLYNNVNWGVDKTNKYFTLWEKYDNGLLVEGNYTDLFLNSDAMIHDSGSFTIEYLTTMKPSLYLLKSEKQLDSLNGFGKKAIEYHYKAEKEFEIDNFLNQVIFDGIDPLKAERISFVNNFLLPPNNKTASQNIFDHLLTQLK